MLEARIPCPLAALDASKERLEREIEPVQYRIFAFAIHARKTAVDPVMRFSQHRNFGVLVFAAKSYAAPISVAALLKQRVVECTRHVQRKLQTLHLWVGRIKPDAFNALHAFMMPDIYAIRLAFTTLNISGRSMRRAPLSLRAASTPLH